MSSTPFDSATLRQASSSSRSADVTSPQTRRVVLVVDDEESNRTYLRRLLTIWELDVQTALDGESALAAIAQRHPDIVLLDVHMPGIDGFEVCRQIKHDPATRLIPVVIVTGLSARQQRIQGINAGADDFLGKPYDAEELQARIRSLLRLKKYTDELESAESVILSLALTVEARDPYTSGHCERLARYCTALGQELGLPEDSVAALHHGAYLHDVGKIGIPDAVLQKPGKLTDAEFALMKQHTLIGERLCGSLRSLTLVRSIVRCHHERPDGTGYPDGLEGDRVPLLAQIVSIADVYDALTTTRPYRPAYSSEYAYQELFADAANGARRQDLVEAFVALQRRRRSQKARIDRPGELGPFAIRAWHGQCA